MPKLLGIDPGQRWVGLATSDDLQSIATPYKTLDRDNQAVSKVLLEILETESIERIVVGYPDPLKVETNERTRQVDEFIEDSVEPLPVPYETISERYSTKEAKRRRRERSEGGEPDDAEAAAVILQTYIDRGSNSSQGRDHPSADRE
ncbi:MAG: Holliday junction resolvase RuvX [bacterium]